MYAHRAPCTDRHPAVGGTRQSRDNTFLNHILFSRSDGFATSRYLSTVSGHMLSTCIAGPKTCLLHHDLACFAKVKRLVPLGDGFATKVLVHEKMKQKPRFERGF